MTKEQILQEFRKKKVYLPHKHLTKELGMSDWTARQIIKQCKEEGLVSVEEYFLAVFAKSLELHRSK